MLVAEGLTKSYRGRTVVGDVSLTLDPGRIVGLVGINGAGKTTTLKMLGGLLEPTSGRAVLDGRATLEPATRQLIGYLPEESPQYDDLDPMAFLVFFGSLYGVPVREARRRGEALLDRLGLAREHWKRPLGTFSKGMRRKVALARCLLHDPDVLLLDEPTSGLDPLTVTELGAFMSDLRKEGKAILLSAHNLPQIEELCDEILVMSGGRVTARGTLAELRSRIGESRYRVRANVPFDGSRSHGTVHEAWFESLAAVERALETVRRAHGSVVDVESVPPRLEVLLRASPPE